MTFGNLEVGDKFVSAVEDEVAGAYQKKSNTSAYTLYGDKDGNLVNALKSDTRKFDKRTPVFTL